MTTNCNSECVKHCSVESIFEARENPDPKVVQVHLYICETECQDTCDDFRACSWKCFNDIHDGVCATEQWRDIQYKYYCGDKMPECLVGCAKKNKLTLEENGIFVETNDPHKMSKYYL